MKTCMIYPNKNEKAIKNYSEDLIKETKVDGLTYTAGKPFTFPFFKAIKYKVIHIQHEYNLLGWYGLPFQFILFFLALLGGSLVITMHNVLPRKSGYGMLRRSFYAFSNAIINLCCESIIVHSQVFKDILVNDYDFDERNVFVIRHGVKEVPKFNKSEIKKKLKLKGNVYMIIGNFHRNHQPHIIMEQSKKIGGKNILIVWNSSAVNDRNKERLISYFHECREIASKQNTLHEITEIDLSYEHPEMWWEFFYACDLVLLPYINGIGSGIFNDAMATGTPVVCSNTNYFREMSKKHYCMESAESNELFDKAIKKAMKNITKLKKGCKEYAKEYSIKRIADRHRRVYEITLGMWE